MQEGLKGSIVFRNVNFTYPSAPDRLVIKNLTCSIEPGKTVAIVGPSGSGKSTVLQLIERFYNVDSGEILMD